MIIFRVIDKKTKQVICQGKISKVAKLMNTSTSTIREHYYDRDNDKRFIDCNWRVERINDGN